MSSTSQSVKCLEAVSDEITVIVTCVTYLSKTICVKNNFDMIATAISELSHSMCTKVISDFQKKAVGIVVFTFCHLFFVINHSPFFVLFFFISNIFCLWGLILKTRVSW